MKARLDGHQVWCYLVAVGVGLLVGTFAPGSAAVFEVAVWPVLALLLFVTFVQMPLDRMAEAFKDVRFLVAALLGNFVVLPLMVWGLIQFFPSDAVIRLGLLLVLLVPCTDWFIPFTQLGRGDAARATAITPLNMVMQLLLLPVYLWLMMDADFSVVFTPMNLWPAFLVVLLPLVAATAIEIWYKMPAKRERVREHLAWGPVPLLSLVVFMVAAANVTAVADDFVVVPVAAGASLAFLILSALIAKLISVALRLPTVQGRTLAFSFGTRNSFVVLPVALALPEGWEIASVIVVLQSLVELLAMILYIWFVPRVLFRGRSMTP
ncbi:MAG: arsenic resistance protein [Microbacterium sp.]|uniref:arsenic resistance protein n=1 Tax=Microbacterium sp. TaxID=51671 RepID=UPI003F94B164